MKNFTSMPNFRKLGVNKNESQTYEDIQTKYNNDDNFASFTESHTLYRSSKPDYLTPKEFKVFLNFNFKTIIDFRSFDEYSKGDGDKLIDEAYTLYKVGCELICSTVFIYLYKEIIFSILLLNFIYHTLTFGYI